MKNNERFWFLGKEFLTWLWFESERGSGKVALPDGSTVRLEFGDSLVLVTGGNIVETATVKAEAPSLAEEMRTALRVGKKVSRARLLLDVPHGEGETACERHYEATVDAADLALSGVRLPTVLGGDDAQVLRERLELLRELEGVVHELWLGFARLRKSDAWRATEAAISAWVRDGECDDDWEPIVPPVGASASVVALADSINALPTVERAVAVAFVEARIAKDRAEAIAAHPDFTLAGEPMDDLATRIEASVRAYGVNAPTAVIAKAADLDVSDIRAIVRDNPDMLGINPNGTVFSVQATREMAATGGAA